MKTNQTYEGSLFCPVIVGYTPIQCIGSRLWGGCAKNNVEQVL